MSRILALDSSTDACSVALYVDGVTTQIFELAAKSHTQRLLPMVDEILATAGCTLKELDAIAFGRGPGSFTGLRICMGIVQGLAFGANLPVIPVSTLQAMAQEFIAQNPLNKLPVLAALDARMDEIYWGLFDTKNGVAEPGDEFVMKPLQLCAEPMVTQLDGKFIAYGPGWHYEDLRSLQPSITLLDVHPRAEHIVQLARLAFEQGKQVSVMDAQPVYLRDTVSWQKRQRIRQ